MTDFQPAYPDTILLDPNKRVFYAHGLVLGVDEFVQEELYLLEKQRLHHRGLHGYGTVCGLALSSRLEDGHVELVVGPGVAIDTRGREIRVAEAQCARLDDWLIRHAEEVAAVLGSPPAGSPLELPLYLVLRYSECTTDEVPVPSGPCQSLDRTSVPSRVADDFRLELCTELETPPQYEEDAVQALLALLRTIEISDAPGSLSDDDMEALVRSLAATGSPPESPSGPYHMHPDDVPGLLRTALRTWVTEVRPRIPGSACNGSPGDGTILLAQVTVPLDDMGAGLRVDGDMRIDESQRPFLLHTRLLQELERTCCARGLVADYSSGGGGGAAMVHIDGAETIVGRKTLAAPLAFTGTGRPRRQIDLLAGSAAVTYASTTQLMTFRSVPAIRFTTSGGPFDFKGSATFDLRLPADLDYGEPIRVRLLWLFDVLPASGSPPPPPPSAFRYRWEVRNRFFEAGERLPQNLSGETPVAFDGEVASTEEFNLLVTELEGLINEPAREAVCGTLQARVARFEPELAQVYLVKADLEYTANRLGRPSP